MRRAGNLTAQHLCRAPSPMRVIKEGAPHRHHIRFPRSDDLFGLLGARDHADGAGRNPGFAAHAVSKMKVETWGLGGDVVNFFAAIDEYPVWRGDLQRGLRISNHILRRPRVLLWEFHQAAFGDLPVTIVGHNPEMHGVKPAADWKDLKKILSLHRFYIHTADPRLEDGYNMAMLEAMAAGLPVLGNRHPTSPIVNGMNGFLSDDPGELRGLALRLLADRDLALQLGSGARETVRRQFSPERFAQGFLSSLSAARAKWNSPQQL